MREAHPVTVAAHHRRELAQGQPGCLPGLPQPLPGRGACLLHLSIDSRIAPFLPPDWVKGPGIDTITFRELLTHRAGFRLDSGLVFTRRPRIDGGSCGYRPNLDGPKSPVPFQR
jgi:hypothetical protein